MNTHFPRQALLVVAALLAFPMAQAAPMSAADFGAGKTRIGADYTADKAACDAQAGNAKDICMEQAKGKEKVARAELEYGYSGREADRRHVPVVKAEAAYAIAKEKCDDQAGNLKDVCVREAKAAETKALADAKLDKQISEASTDAADTKRDADYKVANEKCDALAGDTKAGCVAAAKSQFGKN